MRLAVNIDHIATIREARKTDEPDPVAAWTDHIDKLVETGAVVAS